MPHYAAIWVNEDDHAKLVEVVRSSYLAHGAVPGGDYQVLVGAVVAYGGKKALVGFASFDDLAWLDDERLFGVASANDKLSFWVIDATGTQVCYGGSVRARLGGVAGSGDTAYVATSKGLHRVHLDKPRKATTAAKLDLLWEGEAHDLVFEQDTLHVATATGVLVFADGKLATLTDRPASAVAASGGRVAFLQPDPDTGNVTLRELT